MRAALVSLYSARCIVGLLFDIKESRSTEAERMHVQLLVAMSIYLHICYVSVDQVSDYSRCNRLSVQRLVVRFDGNMFPMSCRLFCRFCTACPVYFCSAMLCVQHSCMHKGVKLLGLCRIFHSIFVILLIWSQLSYLSISALIFISSRRHLPFKSRAGVLFLAGLLAPWTLVQQ